MPNTVLLIHHAWLNLRSWDAVKARYEAKGFTVVAPASQRPLLMQTSTAAAAMKPANFLHDCALVIA